MKKSVASTSKALTFEELKARFKIDWEQSAKDFVAYLRSLSGCSDPPPCVKCDLRSWAYCADTGYCCLTFAQYLDAPRTEKGEE